jgi:hypothetical protein
MNAFTRGYLETALWSSTNDGGDPLDDNYNLDDIHPDTLAQAVKDCDAFQAAHAADIEAVYNACHNPKSWVLAQFGHDFWLTRNRHGAGFWDGDYPEPMATRLTEDAQAYGSIDLYVGDDGRIYGS